MRFGSDIVQISLAVANSSAAHIQDTFHERKIPSDPNNLPGFSLAG